MRRAAMAVLVAWVSSAGAQTRPAPRLDAPARTEIVDTIANQFEHLYVDADTGHLIAEHLRRRAAQGAYNAAADPDQFAQLLSADLRAINDDHHLFVRYSPEFPGRRVGPEGVSYRDPDPPPTPAELERDRLAHYLLGKVDILPGNIGYLEMRGFSGMPASRDVLVAALRYLESTDAIIIDLRQNGGGDGDMSNFLISHFTGPDSVLSLRVLDRSTHDTIDRWTKATVPGPRRPQVPLYVLTSRASASAAEDFAFVLHNLGRATLVGERTYGAGHNNVFVDSGHGFLTSISLTRVMDPRTGREWERVGVQPDVVVDEQQAPLVAQIMAIELLTRRATGERHDDLMLIHGTLEAERKPIRVPTATLARYAGHYEHIVITPQDGHLAFQAYGGIVSPLVALSDSVFAFGDMRLTFKHAQGGAIELLLASPDDGNVTLARH